MTAKQTTSKAAGTLWEQFASRHPEQSFLACETIYSLTEPIIDQINAQVPDFFTPYQIQCELDLARTASFGFFQHRALGITSDSVVENNLNERHARTSKAIKAMLREENRRSGIKDPQTDRFFSKAEERRQVIEARQEAFVGWLISTPAFHSEVNELRAAWQPVVREHGRFPVAPRWPLHDLGLEKAAPEEFRNDFLAFYRRWGLDQLVTWEWPRPMEPDLVGGMVKDLDLLSEVGLVVFVPWYLLRDGKLNLQEFALENRTMAVPDNLRKWVQKTRRKVDELGEQRYERLAWLYRFLILALRRRYPQACYRRAEKLDQALSRVWNLDAESVRKSRLELQRSLVNVQ